MSEQEQAVPKWGDDFDTIPLKRREKLMQLADKQKEWVKLPEDTRGESNFDGEVLDGAEVFFLAAYSLVNESRTIEEAARELRSKVVRPLFNLNLQSANLNGAVLNGSILAGAHLDGANLSSMYIRDSSLILTTLAGANLYASDLSGSNLNDADLKHANLGNSNLSGANFTKAYFLNANLRGANLTGASLFYANMTRCNLTATSMNRETRLNNCVLTDAKLEQATLQDVNLTVVDWTLVSKLGDELEANEPRNIARGMKHQSSRIFEFEAAVRAYRALSVALQAQGLTRVADRFGYRAQVCQRQAYRLHGRSQWLDYAGSVMSWLMAGYGYKLWHIFATYFTVLLIFTGIYVASVVHSYGGEPGIQAWWDSFLVSLSAIHGRTVFESLGAWTFPAWIAGVESVAGIVIEAVFVAMLIQRFFSR